MQTTTTTTPSNIKELNVFNLFSFQQHSATVVGIFVFVCVRWGGFGACLFVFWFEWKSAASARRGPSRPHVLPLTRAHSRSPLHEPPFSRRLGRDCGDGGDGFSGQRLCRRHHRRFGLGRGAEKSGPCVGRRASQPRRRGRVLQTAGRPRTPGLVSKAKLRRL